MVSNPFSMILDFLDKIPFWGWIIMTFIVLFIAAAILGSRDSKKTGKRAGNIIKNMDSKYSRFIETRINNKIIESNSININKEELLSSVLTVLKPDIESLISLINCTNYEDVEVSYNSQFFNNIVTLCQALFKASAKSEAKTLSAEEEEKIYSGIKDSILSDLTTRAEEFEKV